MNKTQYLQNISNIIEKLSYFSMFFKIIYIFLFFMFFKEFNSFNLIVQIFIFLILSSFDCILYIKENKFKQLYDKIKFKNEEDIDFSLNLNEYNINFFNKYFTTNSYIYIGFILFYITQFIHHL